MDPRNPVEVKRREDWTERKIAKETVAIKRNAMKMAGYKDIHDKAARKEPIHKD